MKQLFTTLVLLLWVLVGNAQTPEKISYQAIVRDGSSTLVLNSITQIKISILKNSAAGAVVFAEKQTPSTNENGLISIKIGDGTTLIGSVDAINWGNDLYFIKTEIDVDNNGTYDVNGASQLLSVPYALHAKVAESATEIQSLTDVVSNGNNAGNQLKNVTDPTDDQDAVTKIYVDDLIAELETRIAVLESPIVTIGDFIHGGVVFWVDPTDATHGLVCATTDQASSATWGCMGTDIPGASSFAIGDGAANTTAIVTNCSTVGIAAEVAYNLNLNGYSDWFLPNRNEMGEIFTHKAIINLTATVNGGTELTVGANKYWTSSQENGSSAYFRYISSGGDFNLGKNTTGYVRSIRAF